MHANQCRKCGKMFPIQMGVGDKRIRLYHRRHYCLQCVPLGQRPQTVFGTMNKEVTCSTCGTVYTHNRRSTSKECRRCTKLRKKLITKSRAVEYKGGKCIKCGYDSCLEALSFHHRNPEEKEFKISNWRYGGHWDKIAKELDKCDLLCVRCHVEVHAAEHNKIS